MFEIPLNLACQKISEPTCVDIPLGDPKFRTLLHTNSSMGQKEVHVQVVVVVEAVVVAGGSKAVAANSLKRAVSKVVVGEGVAVAAGSAGIAAAGSKTAVSSKNAASSKNHVGRAAQTLRETRSSSKAQLPTVAVRSQPPSWRSRSMIARHQSLAVVRCIWLGLRRRRIANCGDHET